MGLFRSITIVLLVSSECVSTVSINKGCDRDKRMTVALNVQRRARRVKNTKEKVVAITYTENTIVGASGRVVAFL